jgi:hypothetical protein
MKFFVEESMSGGDRRATPRYTYKVESYTYTIAQTISCFDEIMRLPSNGSSIHDDDCMEVRDDDGMEVCDEDRENDSDNLRDGPNYDIKHSDQFDGQLDAMNTRESYEKMGCIEPCNIYLIASTRQAYMCPTPYSILVPQLQKLIMYSKLGLKRQIQLS